MGVDNTLTRIVDYIPNVLFSDTVIGYKKATHDLLKTIVSKYSENIKSGLSNTIAYLSQQLISHILIDSIISIKPEISQMNDLAVYISNRDSFDFDDLDIQDQLKFVEKEHNNIKKYVKTQTKNKVRKKQMFMEIAQVKDPEGRAICLNKCAQRVETQMGCYCEGKCGSTTWFGGKKWCWVDPEKCKKGKLLNKYRGRAYDLCDNKNVSKTTKCFTGRRYTDCETKKL